MGQRKFRTLVTGGAGAIGSNIVKHLIKDGHEVVIVDDLSSGFGENVHDEAEFISLDISKPFELKYEFDYIIHAAAFFANQNSVDNPIRDNEVNCIGTINILEIAKKSKNLKKMVYLSSSCVYGPREGDLNEDDRINILETPYAITKYQAEKYCDFYRGHYKLPVVNVRIFNSYGPGERPGMYRNVIPNFFKLAIEKKTLTITGTGNETRDFTFVDDIVTGIVKILDYSGDENLFNLGRGKPTKIIDLANLINRIAGNDDNIILKERRSWDHIEHRKAGIERSTKELQYNPEIELETGLLETYNWIKNDLGGE